MSGSIQGGGPQFDRGSQGKKDLEDRSKSKDKEKASSSQGDSQVGSSGKASPLGPVEGRGRGGEQGFGSDSQKEPSEIVKSEVVKSPEFQKVLKDLKSMFGDRFEHPGSKGALARKAVAIHPPGNLGGKLYSSDAKPTYHAAQENIELGTPGPHSGGEKRSTFSGPNSDANAMSNPNNWVGGGAYAGGTSLLASVVLMTKEANHVVTAQEKQTTASAGMNDQIDTVTTNFSEKSAALMAQQAGKLQESAKEQKAMEIVQIVLMVVMVALLFIPGVGEVADAGIAAAEGAGEGAAEGATEGAVEGAEEGASEAASDAGTDSASGSGESGSTEESSETTENDEVNNADSETGEMNETESEEENKKSQEERNSDRSEREQEKRNQRTRKKLRTGVRLVQAGLGLASAGLGIAQSVNMGKMAKITKQQAYSQTNVKSTQQMAKSLSSQMKTSASTMKQQIQATAGTVNNAVNIIGASGQTVPFNLFG